MTLNRSVSDSPSCLPRVTRKCLSLWFVSVVTCIRPAEELGLGVKGQAVGQAQVVLHQDRPLRAVHVGRLDLGSVAVPVRPVQSPGTRAPPLSTTVILVILLLVLQ